MGLLMVRTVDNAWSMGIDMITCSLIGKVYEKITMKRTTGDLIIGNAPKRTFMAGKLAIGVIKSKDLNILKMTFEILITL